MAVATADRYIHIDTYLVLSSYIDRSIDIDRYIDSTSKKTPNAQKRLRGNENLLARFSDSIILIACSESQANRASLSSGRHSSS